MAQQNTIARQELLKENIKQNISNIETQIITMKAGQVAPKHLHPCPVIGYIESGEVLFQIEGEEKKVLKAGQAFYEPKNKNIVHFDNHSKDSDLVFIAFYLKECDEENIKFSK
ncbi:cupin domain-containing protein [Sinomicrobium sp. FJxs]|uniref:Cupin domain-containing protein n=2 Tax=Sinomicrobium weinanense TaxID=2842200 RepID=A0A926JSY9_9FLAO|nr:cupin domain-containing protein [Sinomicrobium weinanense]